MIFRKVSNWTNINNMRGLLFFAQRLDELTFPYTLDSFKTPTTSLRGLLIEAINIIESALDAPENRQISSKKAACHVIEEFLLRVKSNPVAKRCLIVGLKRLYELDFERDSLKTFRKVIIVALAEIDIEQYLAEIVSDVLRLAGSSSKKSEVDLLARELASALQGMDVARDHIQQSVVDFFFSERPIEKAECIIEFCKLVYPHSHKFSVAIGISNDFAKIEPKHLKSKDISVLDDESAKLGLLPETRKSLEAELNAKHVALISVLATDYTSAVHAAKIAVEEIGNFVKVFGHRTDFSVSEKAVALQQCCASESRTVKVPTNHMHFIKDMRRGDATRIYRNFDREISISKRSDQNKFKNILNIHSLSLQSESPDIQLVNLWTCLETMVPSNPEKSNIDSVISALVPVLLLGYINRRIVSVLFDAIRWNKSALWRALREVHAQGRADLKERFILMLTKPENKPALASLYTELGDFELLRFRIHSLGILLESSEKTKDKILEHSKLVEWQLRRIYRVRNAIVHSGESTNFTKYLVENAHDFLDITLMFCMELSKWKDGYGTFESCFDYARSAYESYLSQILNDGGQTVWVLPERKGRSYFFGNIR